MRVRAEGGFTLLEVMLAISVLGVALVVYIELITISLRSIQKASNFTKATFLARTKMEELNMENDLPESAASGYFEDYPDYSWKVEITPIEIDRGSPVKPEPTGSPFGEEEPAVNVLMYKAMVRVTWEVRQHLNRVELVTLKTVLEKPPTEGLSN